MDANDCDFPSISDNKPQRLSFKEARLDQLRYAATLTIEQRLALCYRLQCEAYAWRGIDVTQSQTDFTLGRVTSPKR